MAPPRPQERPYAPRHALRHVVRPAVQQLPAPVAVMTKVTVNAGGVEIGVECDEPLVRAARQALRLWRAVKPAADGQSAPALGFSQQLHADNQVSAFAAGNGYGRGGGLDRVR